MVGIIFEDWEQRKLKKLATFSKGKGYTKSDLTCIGKPIILYGQLYTNYQTVIKEIGTFAEEKENSISSKGNEVIVPSSGESPEDIARASVVEKEGILLAGDLNIIKTNEDIDPVFLAYTISNGKQKKELSKKAQGKSIVHLHNSDLMQVTLAYPKNEEQTKISRFIRSLDDTIALHQDKLEKLKQLKKSYLQVMFPQKGEKVPSLRFADFPSEWEQRKLKDVFSERPERSAYGELISVTINSGVVKASDLDRIDNSSDDKSNYKVVKYGDIAYNSMRMWQGASGYSYYDGILSPAYTVITPREGIDSEFFAFMFKKYDMIQTFKRNSQGLTSDTWNLKFPTLGTIRVNFPSFEEQHKISNFLNQVNEVIKCNNDKLEKLKKLKKVYLQKMFI